MVVLVVTQPRDLTADLMERYLDKGCTIGVYWPGGHMIAEGKA